MVYEQDVHLIKEGQKVHFNVSNRPEDELTATVFAIGKEFEENSRAVHIHAKINGKVSGLISGMYISGHIHTDENYTRTLPNDAVVAEGIKSYIFILDDESLKVHADEENDEDHEMAFRKVEVITGNKDDGYTEIKLIDSLPEDTQVVLNMVYYLLADMNKEETEHEH